MGTDDSRISEIEERQQESELQLARLGVHMEHMSTAVTNLTKSVDGLKTTMDQGRGALWVVLAASSVLGAILTTAISKLFGSTS